MTQGWLGRVFGARDESVEQEMFAALERLRLELAAVRKELEESLLERERETSSAIEQLRLGLASVRMEMEDDLLRTDERETSVLEQLRLELADVRTELEERVLETEKLRLALKSLATKVDWNAEEGAKTALALFERIEARRTSGTAAAALEREKSAAPD